MKRTDAIRLDLASAVIDPLTGWMEVEGTAALVGVMDYPHGAEFVPAETLAKTDGIIGLPVTIQHRSDGELLTIDTTKEEQVGSIIEARYDSESGRLRIRMRITDRSAISAMQSGARELSPGYDAVIERRSGSYNGKSYVAVQTARTYNHFAIVDLARGGREARLDAMETIEIDGIQYQVPPQVAAYIAILSKPAAPAEEPMADAAPTTPTEQQPKTDAAAPIDVAALTATITKNVLEGVTKAIRTDRETTNREARELGDAIVQCRPHLPQSYRTDGKDRGQILLDTIVALRPEMEPLAKSASGDLGRLQGMVDGLTAGGVATRTDSSASAADLGAEDDDIVTAAQKRQEARLTAVAGGKK